MPMFSEHVKLGSTPGQRYFSWLCFVLTIALFMIHSYILPFWYASIVSVYQCVMISDAFRKMGNDFSWYR
jgi:hypothetical protein